MLVLSRKVGERILLPNSNIGVTVVAVQGNRVRLGVSAPADVAVYREELCCQTGRENAQLARKRVSDMECRARCRACNSKTARSM
jgi:carbon storage regulator